MISTSYTGSPPCNLLASANTSAGPTTSSIRAGGTATIATYLTLGRAIIVWLPLRLSRRSAGRFAGIVAEKVGLVPRYHLIVRSRRPDVELAKRTWPPFPNTRKIRRSGLVPQPAKFGVGPLKWKCQIPG